MLLTKDPKNRTKKTIEEDKQSVSSVFIDDFYSAALKRRIKLEVVLPPWYKETPNHSFPLLLMNDGQNLKQIKVRQALTDLYLSNTIPPIIIVGIHAKNRLHEYGVAGYPDYKNRGDKASNYSRFVINELLPLIRKNFRVQSGGHGNVFAGFSLGGLSAFDIVWNYPQVFQKAGVFSGSFWWRSKDYNNGYDDQTDRILHKLIRTTDSKSDQQFWFQTGTEDELSDRNNSGVIDSIHDTLDVISELEMLGFEKGKDIEYLEVDGGKHNEETWAQVFPDFLRWAFGKTT
jgi:enterochelin esterase-like enzyme